MQDFPKTEIVDPPAPFRTVEHCLIPMSDGCRLAATLWIPEGADESPVPAVLEYIPYRRSDYYAVHDEQMHAYFAGRGYACARVDLRGSGDSDGILEDEYLPLEQEDGVEVIRWLAAQPWCSGKVAMIGISWGGFNGLQVAAKAPPELAAVVSMCSTDDRYADDVHYMGGCLLSATMLQWASVMLAYNARPPDPLHVGDRWREIWLERMEKTPPFLEHWVAHQRRDDFWRQGSVCEDYAAIRCPVYMVGGWTDAYRNAVLRFLEKAPGPHKGVIGPWAHTYPEQGVPGPAIGFLQEVVRFLDHHLKGSDNGIEAEPALRVYMPESVRPEPGRTRWPGRWLSLEGWPTREVEPIRFYLAGGTLDSLAPERRETFSVSTPQALHGDAGTWGGLGGPVDNPEDQRADDGASLSFETAPLETTHELLGRPVLRLDIIADRPLALVAARLCDIWPDGTSHLITRGFLNLTHRASHEAPEPLTPARGYVVSVEMNAIAYSLPPRHRLRLAIGTTYWPWIWPSPEPVTLAIRTGDDSRLDLPLFTGGGREDPVPAHFAHPEQAPPPPHDAHGYEDGGRRLSRDVSSGISEVASRGEHSLVLHASGLEYHSLARNLYRIEEHKPLSAFNSYEREISISRGEWRTRVRTTSSMSATETDFQLTNSVEGFEGEARVFARTWHKTIPRDLV